MHDEWHFENIFFLENLAKGTPNFISGEGGALDGLDPVLI